MVTIIDYVLRENSKGDEFVVLKLQGAITMVRSKETGNFYADSKACFITSTFTEEQAQAIIGSRIEGRIVKESCEPYDYIPPNSSEVISLDYRYVYVDTEVTPRQPARMISNEPLEAKLELFSTNGMPELLEA